MEERNHKMEKAGLSIPKILERNRLLVPYKLYQAKLDWKTIVGPQIAKYSYIQGFDESVVQVAVLNSVWMNQLFMYKKKIIEAINEYIKEPFVTDIRFVRSGRKPPAVTYANTAGEEEEGFDVRVGNARLSEETVRRIRQETAALPEAIQEKMAQLRFAQAKRQTAYQAAGVRQCPSCGRWLEKGEELCFLCRLRARQEKKKAVYATVMDMPWLTLDELKAYGMIGDEGRLYEELYNEVRRECIYKYMERIYHGCDTPEDDMILALLITRRNPTEMTDAFIRNLTEKYRRKSDVSSYRRTEND